MKVYPITLAAGGYVQMPVSGDQFLVRTSNGDVDIWSDDRAIDMVGLKAGDGAENTRFDALNIKNSTAAEVTLTLVVSFANFVTKRTQIVGGSGTSDTLVTGSATYGTTPTTLPAISSQIRVRFRAAVANTGTITVAGISYAAGEGDDLVTSAAIPIVASAAGQVLEYLQEAAS